MFHLNCVDYALYLCDFINQLRHLTHVVVELGIFEGWCEPYSIYTYHEIQNYVHISTRWTTNTYDHIYSNGTILQYLKMMQIFHMHIKIKKDN